MVIVSAGYAPVIHPVMVVRGVDLELFYVGTVGLVLLEYHFDEYTVPTEGFVNRVYDFLSWSTRNPAIRIPFKGWGLV